MASSAVIAFENIADRRQFKGVAFVKPSWAPLVGLAHENPDEADCLAANDAVLGWLNGQPASDVFMFSRWPMYFEGYLHTDLSTAGAARYFGPSAVHVQGAPCYLPEIAPRSTLADIPEQHRVIVIGPARNTAHRSLTRWRVPSGLAARQRG